MALVTRFENGITNVGENKLFSDFPLQDPTTIYGQMLDFFEYSNDQWINTTTGSGTVNPSDNEGGVIVLLNSGADNDAIFLQWEGRTGTTNSVSEQYKINPGKRFVFKTRLSLNAPAASQFISGLSVTDTTPFDSVDFVGFIGSSTGSGLSFKSVNSSAASSILAIDKTLVSNEYFDLGFYYDGANKLTYFLNDVAVGSINADNIPETELAITFGLQNNSASASSMNMDYICVYGER